MTLCLVSCERVGFHANTINPQNDFDSAFSGADRLELVTHVQGACSDDWVESVTEIGVESEVKSLFAALTFVPYEEGSIMHCMCSGDPAVRVYAKGKLLGEFTIHHSRSVRWDAVETDIELTDESSAALRAFLKKHGLESR